MAGAQGRDRLQGLQDLSRVGSGKNPLLRQHDRVSNIDLKILIELPDFSLEMRLLVELHHQPGWRGLEPCFSQRPAGYGSGGAVHQTLSATVGK
ncbi:hypothetical protein D3C72_1640960 [compost metagenome]